MIRDLQSFVELLRREGELVEVEVPCDPHLEIAEVHRRVIAAGGPALLFRRPKGASFPVVTNLFGTRKRVELAFGPRPERFVQGLVDLVQDMPPSLGKLWDRRELFWQAAKIGTRLGSGGPVTEVFDAPPGLDRLPLLTCWERDGGPFVTLPLVYTEHPEHGGHNLGMYRVQRYDERTTGMHWQIGKGGGFHHAAAEARGEDLPVTIFVGGPPALMLAAIAPLPENVPELMLASLALGGKLRQTPNPAGPHPLVADAEFALIGRVPAGERRPEGPFGDHYGYYSLRHDYPVFHCKALCRRRDPLFPATVVGKPRQEDFFLGDYLTELLSPLFPLVMPAVRALWSYGETGYHSLSAAVVHERYEREAMASAFRVLGEGQLSLTKFLLLTDQPVDLRDFPATLETVLARFRPETDLYVLSRLSMDTLDYTGPDVNKGSKGVMLGIGEPVRELPRAFSGELPPGFGPARVYCAGCLVVQAPGWEELDEVPLELADRAPDWPLVVLVDGVEEATRTDARFLWTVFTRFEPAGDLHARHEVHRHHLVYSGPILLDARKKPSLPDELFCDPGTAGTVERRWAEYFPSGGVEMGDSDVAHLDR